MREARHREDVLSSLATLPHGVTTIEFLDIAQFHGIETHAALALLRELEHEGVLRAEAGYLRMPRSG